MDYLKLLSVIFAVVSIVAACIVTVLHLSKKLRPTRRKHPDNAKVNVPIAFYSYLFTHYLLCYSWWFAWQLEIDNKQYDFDNISKGLSAMILRSERSLEDLSNFESPKRIIKLSDTRVSDNLKGYYNLAPFDKNLKESEKKIRKGVSKMFQFELVVKKIALDNQCNFEFLNVTKNLMTETADVIETTRLAAPDNHKIEKLAGELTGVFAVDKLLAIGKVKVDRVVKMRKEILSHVKDDIKNIETNRQEIVNKLKEQTPDKFHYIRTTTYWQIFATLSITFLVLIGFGRSERMDIKWPSRFCSSSVLLAALNTIFFGMFMIYLSVYNCPSDAEKLDHSHFFTQYNPSVSDSTPVSICPPNTQTIFSFLRAKSDLSVSADEIVEEYKDDVNRVGSKIAIWRIDDQMVSKKIGEMKKFLETLRSMECGDLMNNSVFSDYIRVFSEAIESAEKIVKFIEESNVKFESGMSPFEKMIASFYEDAHNFLEQFLKKVQTTVVSVDIACGSIKHQFEKAPNLVCNQLNIPLNLHWILLFVSLMFLDYLLILNCFVYRTLVRWEMDKRGQLKKEPTTTSEVPPARRNRRQRLERHVF